MEKENKEKKKVPRKKKRRVGGGSPLTIINARTASYPLTIISSKKMPVRLRTCWREQKNARAASHLRTQWRREIVVINTR